MVNDAGLSVFDFSNPNSPVQIGAIAAQSLGVGDGLRAVGVNESGTRVYVSGETGTRIVDVSNPSQPLPRGFIPKPAAQIKSLGNLIYLASGWTGADGSGISIVDASSPDSPAIVGTFSFGSEWFHRIHAVTPTDTLAYLVSEYTFAIVDVTNPGAPILRSHLDFDNLNFEYRAEIAIVGTRAFVAAGYAGLLVIDVSDSRDPRVVGTLPGTAVSVLPSGHATLGAFSDISVVGDYAYLLDSHEGRLVVADISNPAQPKVVGRNTLFAGEGHAGSMEVTDDFVFVAFRNGNPDLVVFNHYVPDLRIGPAIVADDGRLRFRLSGASGQCVRVQRSINLKDWADWKTVTLGDTGCELSDETSTASQRFYRAIEDNSGQEAIKPRMDANRHQ
jgi:hypothetical protein